MNYVLQVAPLAPTLQLSPVQISQGTLFASEPLQLTLALGQVTMRRNRACVAGPVALALTLPEVRIGKAAQTMTVTPLQIRPRLSKATLTYSPYLEIPQVFPTTREFIPPALDITEVPTQAGTVVQRIWASQPGGGSLRLGFANIPDADAERLAKIWDRSKGKRFKLTLPRRFFEGEDPALLEHLELKGQPLTWGLREKPTIRSVIPGISSIDLEFKGRGYGGLAIPLVTTPDPPRVMPVDPLPVLLGLSSAGLRANRIGKSSPLPLALELSPVNIGPTGPLKRATVSPLSLTINTPGARLSRGSVSMLLPMTGSNGSIVFTDTSSNAIAVTRFGDARISTAQSRWGSGSGLFDGNGDYLAAGPNAALQLGTVNFTIEMWIRFNAISNQALYETIPIGGNGSRPGGFVFVLESTGRLNVFSNGAFRGASTTTLAVNTWHHLALVRSNTTWAYKINGATDATTFTLSINLTDQSFVCGRVGNLPDYYLNAHVQDLRVVRGSALYGATYTLPAGPLPALL